MSLVSTLARAEAMITHKAQPIASFRHRHLSDRPLVLIPLMMAGEAAAPLAVMLGTSKYGGGQILTVPQPRNRDQRFAFAADLGRIVMDYIDSFRADRVESSSGGEGEAASRFSDAPQILVPNRGGITAVRHLGRMTRFRQVDGPSPVDAVVPEAGFWFTVMAERAEYAGSSLLIAMTDLLSELWATGQSSMEDQNLASLIGWIDPPGDMTGLQAGMEGEDPIIWPPAGPATDPDFDNKVLAPAITAFDAASARGDAAARSQAEARLHAVISTQLQPTWNKMWQGVALARAVPEAPRAQRRWDRECAVFTARSDYLAAGGRPQPKRDYPITAARRLSDLEAAATDFERERALDDPFALADLRCTGEAFGGIVQAVEADRTVVSAKNRRTLRPRFTVVTTDPLKIPAETKLISPQFPTGHKTLLVQAHAEADGTTTVLIEVTGGMGTPNKPIADAVPAVGQRVAFLPDAGYQRRPAFPDPEHTPWTHGGPPAVAGQVNTEDADEQWGSQ
jgi:hypothetical protein